ncbi:MAG: hypothetical protein CVV34_02110, partial [Methanomicrobiales archaeon HGW-Methanomicrobiales-5]
MDKETDEALNDTNSLLNLIRGKKKTEDSSDTQDQVPPRVSPLSDEGATGAGNFSELLKKLGMAKKEVQQVPGEPKIPSVQNPPEEQFSFLDDLLEDIPQTPTDVTPPDMDQEIQGNAKNDNRASTEKWSPVTSVNPVDTIPTPEPVLSQFASPPTPEPGRDKGSETDAFKADREVPREIAPDNSATEVPPAVEKEPVIEIIEEDPKAYLRKSYAKNVTPAAPTVAETEAGHDEKIISVDQVTDFSGLILPKGAT